MKNRWTQCCTCFVVTVYSVHEPECVFEYVNRNAMHIHAKKKQSKKGKE